MKSSSFQPPELIDLIQTVCPVSYTCYDPGLNQTGSIHPIPYDLSALFELTQMPLLQRHLKSQETLDPVLLTDSMELLWACVFEWDPKSHKQCSRIHVLGPVFYDSISLSNVERGLSRHRMPITIKHRMIEALKHLPTVYMMHFVDYTIMLHKQVNGETASLRQIRYLNADRPAPASITESDVPVSGHARHGTWEVEQRMMQMIEDGNLNYQAELHALAQTGHVGQLAGSGSDHQFQYMVLVSTALSSRAAIRGGLSPETAMTLCDQYFQEIDLTTNVDELRTLHDRMLDDFIHRVHDCRTATDRSAPIRQCCEYIRFHYQEKISAEKLAEQIGYSGSYLSKKFKKEMHQSLTDYIASVKIEKAMEMLRNPSISIADVSDLLGFASQSYFGVQFKKHTGITPGEFQRLGYLPDTGASPETASAEISP